MSDLSDLRWRLCENGYTPLPLYGKVPPNKKNNKRKSLTEWEQISDVTPAMILMWEKTWGDARNTGLLTKTMPVLDADIMNEEAARAIEDHVREHYEDGGYILVRVGKPPKRAFLFRTNEPFAKFSVNVIAPNGSEEKIEFLANGAQVAAFGEHPDTLQPYRWFGGTPDKIKRDDLPYIRGEEAHALVDALVQILVDQHGYKRAPARPRQRKANGKTDGADVERGTAAADWQYLTDNIHVGRDLHKSTRELACKLIRSGMKPGAAVNYLRGLLNSSQAPRDDRWQERFDNIPSLVDSAVELVAVPEQEPAPAPMPLAQVHATFKKWLGDDYDIDVLDAVLAAAAAERLTGDPLWLLVISGPGNAKTETVQALAGAGAHVTSTIASEGALLSATPRREKSKQATGGLLRKIGDRGVLVIKDVTSILSADRNTRASVLAAVREVYDGKWERNVGTDGGRTLTWTGRIVLVGAVTTAWDAAHAVVASMGDRFVVVRADSKTGRSKSATKAIRNTGAEVIMRKELAGAVAAIVGNASKDEYRLSDGETDRLVKAADIVTMARTAVERDYKGEVLDAHAPEMPTRYAKQLAQLVRGAGAIGMTIDAGMRLAIRCARDSIPPLRREILLDIAANPSSQPHEVHRRIGRPRNTVRRELEALYMLRLLQCDETDEEHGGKMHTRLHYSLADEFDRATLLAM